jgi:hypothetical protein
LEHERSGVHVKNARIDHIDPNAGFSRAPSTKEPCHGPISSCGLGCVGQLVYDRWLLVALQPPVLQLVAQERQLPL